MVVTELISTTRVSCHDEISSKKRVLEELSTLLASNSPDRTAEEVFDSLFMRERLGSTGLGKGIAIPHGRMSGLNGPLAAFVRLKKGIEFDALDNQPVDLLFALLVPEESSEQHLELLAQIAELFSDELFVARLRSVSDRRGLYELLSHWEPHRESA